MLGREIFPAPAEDAAAVRLVSHRFAGLAAGFAATGGRVDGLQVAAHDRWAGAAAARCDDETRRLGAETARAGDAMGDTGGVLERYATTVADVADRVRELQQRYDAMAADHEAALRRVAGLDPETTSESERARLRADLVLGFGYATRPLHVAYDEAREDLRRAAGTAATALLGVAARLGVHPLTADPSSAVRRGMRQRLPLLSAADAREAARDAVAVLRGATAYDDTLALALLGFEQWADDPAFATAFLEELGPEELLAVPYYLTLGGSSLTSPALPDQPGADDRLADYQRMVSMLGRILAAGTDPSADAHVSADWRARLLAAADGTPAGPVSGWYSLGVLLRSGDYSEEFLREVAPRMMAIDDQGDAEWRLRIDAAIGGGIGWNGDVLVPGGNDPLVGLMTAMTEHRALTQELVDGRLDRLLLQRRWGDDGDALGRALEQAATGSLDEPTSRLAATLVQVLAGAPDRMPEAMRDSVGNVLAWHIAWVDADLAHVERVTGATTAQRSHDVLDLSGTTPVFSARDLAAVLGEIFLDDDAYAAVLDAHTALAALTLAETARAEHAAGSAQLLDDVTAMAERAAFGYGALERLRADAIGDAAAAADAADARMAMLAASLAGLVPLPVAGTVEKAIGVLRIEIGKTVAALPDAAAAARQESAVADLAAVQVVHDMLVRAMVDAQLVAPGRDPASWLAQQPADIAAHPFTAADGTLLGADELLADPQALVNLQQWVRALDGGLATIGAAVGDAEGAYNDGAARAQRLADAG